MFQSLRHLHDELGIVHVVLGEEAVPQIDATLVVDIVRGHVVGADHVVDTAAWATNRGDDVVTGLEFGNVRPNLFDATETFMPDDEELVSWRGGAVFRRIDFFVGSVHAYAK